MVSFSGMAYDIDIECTLTHALGVVAHGIGTAVGLIATFTTQRALGAHGVYRDHQPSGLLIGNSRPR